MNWKKKISLVKINMIHSIEFKTRNRHTKFIDKNLNIIIFKAKNLNHFTPKILFESFFDDKFWFNLVNETNRYAAQYLDNNKEYLNQHTKAGLLIGKRLTEKKKNLCRNFTICVFNATSRDKRLMVIKLTIKNEHLKIYE